MTRQPFVFPESRENLAVALSEKLMFIIHNRQRNDVIHYLFAYLLAHAVNQLSQHRENGIFHQELGLQARFQVTGLFKDGDRPLRETIAIRGRQNIG